MLNSKNFKLFLIFLTIIMKAKSVSLNKEDLNYKNGTLCVVYESQNDKLEYDFQLNNLEHVKNSFSIINLNFSNEIASNKFQIACANFDFREGWHILDIKTFEPFDNVIQSYFAGYIEGYIYHELISYHHTNLYKTIFYNEDFSESLKLYIKKQNDFVRKLVDIPEINEETESFNADELKKKSLEEKKYYLVMKYVIYQSDGLYQGQHDGAIKYGKIPLTIEELYRIINHADFNDLIPAFKSNIGQKEDKNPNYILNEIQNESKFFELKECSGFVRFVSDTNNLIMAHTTHNIYSMMNRIYKNYDFNLKFGNKKLNSFKFSSRPGDLNSKDDYYILSNNMSLLETSLNIHDLNLYKNLKPETVPKWIRINVANRLANNNLEWIDLFFRHNSGTHNNQWLVVDYNKFDEFVVKNDKIQEKVSDNEDLNIIHLVEQIPVLDKSYYRDFSQELIKDGYVASYNAPYFEEVIELAGYKDKHADYSNANRYFLFKKLAQETKSVDDVKKLMEYHDKINICDTIAPRCDTVQNFAFGSIDGKITDRNMIKNMKSVIKYGPPYIEGITEPFDFTKFSDVSHLGIPENFDFKWIDS